MIVCVVDIGMSVDFLFESVQLYIVQSGENMVTVVIKMFTTVCRGTTLNSCGRTQSPIGGLLAALLVVVGYIPMFCLFIKHWTLGTISINQFQKSRSRYIQQNQD